MRAVLRVLFQCLCLIAALSLSGVHYGVGQAVAWADMLIERSSNGEFTQAVGSTFDGEHPCQRCLKIQQESSKEQQQPQQKALKEFKPITGGLQALPQFVFLSSFSLLPKVTEPAPTERAGFHDEAFQPPERA